ncbi:MAG: hypothetical protein RLY86_4330 [Pseudomonadota bacterium]|jgi:HPt (histidine-containing phosphotransfer) domain-containing protein
MADQTPPPLPRLDRSVLDGHREVLGDETVRDVIARFLDTAPATAMAAAEAAAAGDLVILAKQAHKLAGGALTLGLAALNDIARRAEHEAKTGAPAEAIAAATALPDALDAARRELQDYLTGLGR